MRTASGGRVRGPQPAFFMRVLGERRAIRQGGGGAGRHKLTPSPQDAITTKNAHHTRPLSVQSVCLSV